jgi:hypothetical protein
VIILLLLLLYLGLWIYVTNSLPEDLKQQYEQSVVLDISDSQYKIIWFTWTENKNYGLRWYPFGMDMIFRNANNGIDSYSALLLLYSNERTKNILMSHSSRLPVWNIEYGLTRYIRKKNNYKRCIDIIITQTDMEKACEYYFNKSIKNTSDMELIALTLRMKSSRYEIGSKISENK